MKTIAITIEETVLERLDRLPRRRGDKKRNRSLIIRQAVGEYIARLEHQADSEREAVIVRRHRDKLSHQATALVGDQAKP